MWVGSCLARPSCHVKLHSRLLQLRRETVLNGSAKLLGFQRLNSKWQIHAAENLLLDHFILSGWQSGFRCKWWQENNWNEKVFGVCPVLWRTTAFSFLELLNRLLLLLLLPLVVSTSLSSSWLVVVVDDGGVTITSSWSLQTGAGLASRHCLQQWHFGGGAARANSKTAIMAISDPWWYGKWLSMKKPWVPRKKDTSQHGCCMMWSMSSWVIPWEPSLIAKSLEMKHDLGFLSLPTKGKSFILGSWMILVCFWWNSCHLRFSWTHRGAPD